MFDLLRHFYYVAHRRCCGLVVRMPKRIFFSELNENMAASVYNAKDIQKRHMKRCNIDYSHREELTKDIPNWRHFVRYKPAEECRYLHANGILCMYFCHENRQY